MRAYGSVVAFRGRLSMVVAASEPHFLTFPYPSLQKRFDALILAAAGFSGRRNEIAHGIVQIYIRDAEHDGYAVIPSYFATNKRGVIPGATDLDPLQSSLKYAYTSAELAHWATHFMALSQNALDLFHSLSAARAAGKEQQKARRLGRALTALGRSSAESSEPSPKGPKG